MEVAAALNNPIYGGIKKNKGKGLIQSEKFSLVLDQPKSGLQRWKKT